MAFMGETEEIGVAELLSVLARRKHSGRLSITAEGEEVQIFLEHGKVILVSSSNHALRLGRVLVRLGMVSSQQLDAAIREQDLPGSGRPLGQILVDAGWITREQLATAAQEQCVEALTRVIIGKHGTFMFTRDAKPVTKQGLVALNTDRIVLEASRRADEMMTLRGLLPAPTAHLSVVRDKVETTADAEITQLERHVMMALNSGTGTLADLLQRVSVDEASLWRTVISLRDRGLIVARGATATPEPAQVDRPPERSIEEIVQLGTAGPRDVSTRIPTITEIRTGGQASSQSIAAVTVVVREVIAAFNAGLHLRAFANFSDDHFRRQGRLPDDQIARATSAGPSAPGRGAGDLHRGPRCPSAGRRPDQLDPEHPCSVDRRDAEGHHLRPRQRRLADRRGHRGPEPARHHDDEHPPSDRRHHLAALRPSRRRPLTQSRGTPERQAS